MRESIQPILDLFAPTPLRIIGCVTAVAVQIIVTYWSIIILALAQGANVDAAALNQSIPEQASLLNQIPYGDRVVNILVWFVALLLLYLAYVRVLNGIINLRNEYVVMTEFTNPPSWHKEIISQLPRVALYAGVFILGLVSFNTALPYLLGMAGFYFYSFFEPYALPAFISAVICMLLNWYLLIVAFQTTHRY